MIQKATLITLAAVLFYFGKTNAQNCPTLGQNPFSAFPVCGTNVFNQTVVPICAGRAMPTPCRDGVVYEDKNPFWYKFTCFTSGTLGFEITPIDLTDDYDWQLFDVTGRDPNDVYTDLSLMVSCNWSGNSGKTGTNNSGNSSVACAGFTFPTFNQMPDLIAGHEYLLMVSHFTDSQIGYSLSFGGGTAVITDLLPPALSTATAVCSDTLISVKLNKKMKCSSITKTGSDFKITPNTVSIVKANGIGCSTEFDTDSILLTLSSSLTPGNYSLITQNGIDGNTILDICDNGIPVGASLPITILAAPPTPMDSITTPLNCAPTSLHLVFKNPIQCNSVAANGSDFIITGPSAVTVNSASVNCNNGVTNEITLNLATPIKVGGLYTIKLQTGSDGNTIINQCGTQTPQGSSLSFRANDTVSAQIDFQLKEFCGGDSIIFSHNGNVNQWNWTFDNSITRNTQTTRLFYDTSLFPFTVTAKLQVTNGVCTDTRQIQINLPKRVLKADFSFQDSVCANTPVVFTDKSIQNVTNWKWDFGNGNTSTSATPSPQTYPIINIDKKYPVKLVVQNIVGCADSMIKNIFIFHTDPKDPALQAAEGLCDGSLASLKLNKKMRCNTLTASGSEFRISPPASNIISVTGIGCNTDIETDSLIFNLGTTLSPGNYFLISQNGTDGNTLIDICGKILPANESISMKMVPFVPTPMDSITPPNTCAPQSLTLVFRKPLRCNSIAANGSDFSISGPSTVSIVSAAGNCNTFDLSRTITLSLSSPLKIGGTYTITLKRGTDGNTVFDYCDKETPAGETVSFSVKDTVSAAFNFQVHEGCIEDTVLFFHNGLNGVNEWKWIFDNSITKLSQNTSATFNTFSIHTASLQVSNGTCADTTTKNIDLSRVLPHSDFSFPDLNCARFSTIFTDLSTGKLSGWNWNFGNGNSSILKAPPAQTYPIINTDKQYPVRLIVTDSLGCSDTLTKNITVIAKDPSLHSAFEAPEFLCPGDIAKFNNNSVGNILSWFWDFGNNTTSTLKDPQPFSYSTGVTTKTYKVILIVQNDKSCVDSSSENVIVPANCLIAVPNAFTPNGDGLNDYLYPLNGYKADNLDFRVYNRFGQLVWQTNDWTRKWDGHINGEPQNTQSFVWTLSYTEHDTGKKILLKGTTMLVR